MAQGIVPSTEDILLGKRTKFLQRTEFEGKELEELGRSWLVRTYYNLMGGEWWYSTIKPKLYIEEEIYCDGPYVPEYKFHCVNGEIQFIFSTNSGENRNSYTTMFDPEF